MNRKGKRLLVILGSLALLCGCEKKEQIMFFSEPTENTVKDVGLELKQSEESVKIMVYVCGQVKEPGVVEADSKARVVDVISMAGGMTEKAAQNYINLADKLTDGEMIYVPTQEEVLQWETDAQKEERVNINTADAEELCKLHGIGESKAADIIVYRKKNGDFRTKEELMKVPGIKESLYEKIADRITVD